LAIESLDLLIVCLQSFPSPFRHHSQAVEIAIVNLLLKSTSTLSNDHSQETDTAPAVSRNGSSLLGRAAQALALLPTAAGDAATWSSLIRRILFAANALLSPAFVGLESPLGLANAVAHILDQNGGFPSMLGTFDWALTDEPESQLWAPTVPLTRSLLTAVQLMLTSPYPVPVSIPISPVLALVSRILKGDGSISPAAYDTLARDREAAISAELPNLQTLALDLAGALLASGGTHLLPHGEQLVALVGDALRQTAGGGFGGPGFRVRVYGTAVEVLEGLGAGEAEKTRCLGCEESWARFG
jgi:hypothetical protein